MKALEFIKDNDFCYLTKDGVTICNKDKKGYLTKAVGVGDRNTKLVDMAVNRETIMLLTEKKGVIYINERGSVQRTVELQVPGNIKGRSIHVWEG